MSSDTAKENASVVDSSVTEWKHDMGNSDDPESPSYKGVEDGCPIGSERGGHDQVANSSKNKIGKQYNTRYFIIKSLNHQNLQLSVEKGIWATQVMNEPILEEAFHNSERVILIFSVNMSGFFQGYAQMMSSIGWRRDNVWSQGSGKNNPWGHSFKVKWLRLNDLPFQKTLHLKNPLNDYKPVKISRDCQELPEDIGESLCDLIDGESDVDGSVKGVLVDGRPLKRSCVKPTCSPGDGEYNAPPLHMAWANMHMPMPYPPFLCQPHGEASRFHLAQQGSTGATFPENAPLASGPSKLSKMKNTNLTCDVHSRIDVRGLSAESPLASSLTDDDFLEMTYEEYLEVHSRSHKQLNVPGMGPSKTKQESSRSKKLGKLDDDLSRSRKRSHCSSEK